MWGAVACRPPHHLTCPNLQITPRTIAATPAIVTTIRTAGRRLRSPTRRVTSVLQASPRSSAGASASARSSCQPWISPAAGQPRERHRRADQERARERGADRGAGVALVEERQRRAVDRGRRAEDAGRRACARRGLAVHGHMARDHAQQDTCEHCGAREGRQQVTGDEGDDQHAHDRARHSAEDDPSQARPVDAVPLARRHGHGERDTERDERARDGLGDDERDDRDEHEVLTEADRALHRPAGGGDECKEDELGRRDVHDRRYRSACAALRSQVGAVESVEDVRLERVALGQFGVVEVVGGIATHADAFHDPSRAARSHAS